MIRRFIVLMFVGIILFSCSEDFTPYGDEVNKYVLNCIIRVDTTYQTAIISRSYIVDNLDPLSNAKDPNVYNAIVRLYNGDSYAELQDTTITLENSIYKSPYVIHQTRKFLPDQNSPLTVEAILPNGKTLSGTTILARKAEFYKVENTIPPEKNNFVNFIWNVSDIVNAYLSRFGINYYKLDDPVKKLYTFYVPLEYINEGGIDYPLYPTVGPDNFFQLSLETVSKAMNLISKGDVNKGNYVILDAKFEVFSMDSNLSEYYNAVNRGKDIYSVKLNDSDFSKVSGAFGVVGSFARNEWILRFSHTYIRTFEYTPGLSDVDQ